eukprot:g14679.t1
MESIQTREPGGEGEGEEEGGEEEEEEGEGAEEGVSIMVEGCTAGVVAKRKTRGKKKKNKHHGNNHNQHHGGNNHGLPNNQPYAAGHPQPYVSNAQHGGEEKVEEAMPVAIGVPLEK